MPKISLREWAVAFVTGVILTAGGCDSGLKLHRVSGKVTYKGKPVPNVIVHFVPGDGHESTGATDESGAYKLRFDRDNEGAIGGKHRVYFQFRSHNPQEDMDFRAGKLKLPPETAVAVGKYGDKESKLSFDVTQGSQVIDIALD
ncbi:hypothetical protein [Fimbriiglobus ruber]|uniref:Carboxypeptidase regulatory-like domain-containing protein n=1 Tax=Fimbriiglobus ruber TaxID=1908690 RepID=A0A225DVG9_9BACT|nr:hypothetical protein [Fimbriiglobus ruber]OWK45003.1 hypothetical protein FRUB_01334 [Fimbriiglobus ruber]